MSVPSEIVTLHPNPGAAVDPIEAVAGDARPAPTNRPWVLTNMVTSLDGGTAVDGLSGALGGPADLAVFVALRAVADFIIVGAGTAISEGYKPPRPSERVTRMRTARGQSERPVIVVVSRSLSIDPSAPLFSDPDYRPILLTVDDAPPDRLSALSPVADIVYAGTGDVDLVAGLATLRDRGAIAILEGGPKLNGQFVSDDLVDEWNQTLSPVLISGSSARPAAGEPPAEPLRFELDRLWSGDSLLFGRWLRAGARYSD